MRTKSLWTALAAATLVLALAAGGGAATSALPGGTSFEVDVTSPHEGDVLPEGTPYTVSGEATVGKAAPVASTWLVTVIDVSGSTVNPVSTTACGDVNTVHDSTPNTVLDCELAAARALNDEAVSQGTVVQASIVGFAGRFPSTSEPLDNEARALDLGPTAAGFQTTIPPADDANSNGTRDINEVLASAFNQNVLGTFALPPEANATGFSRFSLFTSDGNTNYWAAMTATKNLLDPAPPGVTKVVVMLSDGEANVGAPNGEPLANVLNAMPGVKIYTFAIGNLASCTGADGSFGTLQQIALTRGGTCTRLTNPADAVNVVPDAIGSKSTDFGTNNTGGTAFDPATSVAPVPPATLSSGALIGPGSATFSRTYPGSAPGPKTLCVSATGSDGGGSAPLSDCVHVTIKARPTVVLDNTTGSTDEGSPFAVGGTVDGASSTAWSASGGTGTCTFGDPSAASTSVTCNDDGDYTLTLTANDGVNSAVAASMTLHVSNVAPTATLTVTPTVVPIGGPGTAHVAVTDPGNDAENCVINWGDGASSNLCDASHAYSTAGDYTVGASVDDGDGGVGTDTASVQVKGPPTVAAGADGSVDEGSAFSIGATVTGSTSVLWSAAGGTGTCTFTPVDAANTSVTCDDDGLYTLTITATDAFGQTGTDTVLLVVRNVRPTVTLTLTPAQVPSGGLTTADVTAADPGHDVALCTINWGDGSPLSNSCHDTHTYAAPADYVVTALVDDGDGGLGVASKTAHVNGPPAVTVDNASGAESSAIRLTATATDADGDTLTLDWTAAPIGSVDPGAACTFANPHAAATTVTCNDDGQWTLTLTASDGVNSAVAATGTLTVTNAAPSLVISNPAAGASARSVSFTGIVTDPGTNDAADLRCTINWRDGTSSTVAVIGGFCSTTHTYADSVSGATIDATASDGDSGSAAKSVTLTFNRAPVCVNVKAIPKTLWPPNGKFRPVLLVGATDPDGDRISYSIVSIFQDEPLDGKHKKNQKIVPDAVRGIGPLFFLRAERDGRGDGRVYTITYTVTDSHGLSCTGTTTVSVPRDQHRPAVKSPGSYNSFG